MSDQKYWSEEQWKQVEDGIADLKPKWEDLAAVVIPVIPGNYKDNQGDKWTLNEDGTWTDHEGVTRPKELNWVLAAAAPYERVY